MNGSASLELVVKVYHLLTTRGANPQTTKPNSQSRVTWGGMGKKHPRKAAEVYTGGKKEETTAPLVFGSTGLQVSKCKSLSLSRTFTTSQPRWMGETL